MRTFFPSTIICLLWKADAAFFIKIMLNLIRLLGIPHQFQLIKCLLKCFFFDEPGIDLKKLPASAAMLNKTFFSGDYRVARGQQSLCGKFIQILSCSNRNWRNSQLLTAINFHIFGRRQQNVRWTKTLCQNVPITVKYFPTLPPFCAWMNFPIIGILN